MLNTNSTGRHGGSVRNLKTLWRWDVSSNLGAVTRTGIFPSKKVSKVKKMPNKWRAINSLVHKIRLHGQRGKGTAESFSREKLRQAPQNEAGESRCDLPPVWPRLVRPQACRPEWMGWQHTHTNTYYILHWNKKYSYYTKIKMPNGWKTIKSLVHKIRLHDRREKWMAESFSREKLRHAPQKEGGWEFLCDLPPVWPWLVRPTNLMSRMNGKKTHTHTHRGQGKKDSFSLKVYSGSSSIRDFLSLFSFSCWADHEQRD